MEYIAIFVSKWEQSAQLFSTEIWHRFPSNAKGLALAVIAVERMMNIEAHHIAFADLNIKFILHDEETQDLSDKHMFELIARHRAGFSILAMCKQVIDNLAGA